MGTANTIPPVQKTSPYERGSKFLHSAPGILCVLALVGFILLVGFTWGVWHDTSVHAAMGEKLTITPPPAPPQISQADYQKLLDAVEDAARQRTVAAIDEEKKILDTLVTLVGIYAALLGVTAFVTVKLSRDEAKEQMDQLSRKLQELKGDAQASLEKFQENIRRDVPEIHRLHERILGIMYELQSTLPPEKNWNDDESYSKLSEADRQQILVAESTVTALAIFNLQATPVLREALGSIWRGLARFYLGRHNHLAAHDEADYERAIYYASQCIHMLPKDANAYRLRGAIRLGRFNTLALAATSDPGKELMGRSVQDLKLAIQCDVFDAGAYYNLALLYCFQNNLDSAIDQSNEIVRNKDKIARVQRDKYLPDIYVNLACYLARKAGESSAQSEKDRFRQQAVDTIKEANEELQKPETPVPPAPTPPAPAPAASGSAPPVPKPKLSAAAQAALKVFYAGLEREMKPADPAANKPAGDLAANLTAAQLAELAPLLP